MEECEICGKDTDTVYTVLVEGVELHVCPSCARGKHIISDPTTQRAVKRQSFGSAPHQSEDPDLIDGYGMAIRNARERLKLPLKVLAEMINEKETFLERVEAEKTTPPMPLVRKLEKALSIKLIAGASDVQNEHSFGANTKTTLGDYIEPGKG